MHAHVIIYAIQTKFEKIDNFQSIFGPMSFNGQIGWSKPTERVQGVLDDLYGMIAAHSTLVAYGRIPARILIDAFSLIVVINLLNR